MDEEESKAMTKKIFTLVKYSRDVARFRQMMHGESAFVQQHQLVDSLLEYISKEAGIQSGEQQLAVLREAVADRVGGITDAEAFLARLKLNAELGGANYSEKDATKVTWFLEKLIAQGGYVIRPNELLGGHT